MQCVCGVRYDLVYRLSSQSSVSHSVIMASWAIKTWMKLDQLTPQQKHDLENKWRREVEEAKIYNSCWLYNGRKKINKNGYGEIYVSRSKAEGRGFYAPVHIVSLFFARSAAPDSSSQTSHLCHRRDCLRYEHLVFEGDGENKKRQSCNRPPKGCRCGLTPKCFPK